MHGREFTLVFPTHILLRGSGERGPLERSRCAGLLPTSAAGLMGSWGGCQDPPVPSCASGTKEGEHPTSTNHRLPAHLGEPLPPYRPPENPGTKPV